jgi:hypothetical protein
MLKIKFFILLLIVILIVPTAVLAQELIVTKTAPSQISFGQYLNVTITIVNNLNQKVSVTVRENIADAEAIEPQLITPKLPPGIKAARPPYFEWRLSIDANSQANTSYTIRPNKVGDYLFSPTTVIRDDGKIFYSNTLSTLVKCNINNVCEESIGEDFTNCPEDCKPPTPAGQPAIQIDQIYIVIIAIGVIGAATGIFLIKRAHKKHAKVEAHHKKH